MRVVAIHARLALLFLLTVLPSVVACGFEPHRFGKREEGSGSDLSLNSGGSAAAIAAYDCDPTTCKLPSCRCASTDAPGGLKPEETPMFLVFTADDAIQTYTTRAVNSLLARRLNPNNCSIKMTYFTSLSYTNYSQVTEWYMRGNEIADHTMTHVGQATASEINGNILALNSLAGIPLNDIRGFRAPYLNYTTQTLRDLKSAGFLYDSSSASSMPANDSASNAFWPYTLDHGLLNDCSKDGFCYGEPKIEGLWEVPLSASFGRNGDIHLMDPWLDDRPETVLEFLKDTFMSHYNGRRQPFGLWTHPIHLATGYPGLSDPLDKIQVVNDFLDWAQQQPNVWIVSVEQLLEWVMDPKSISQLDQSMALSCSAPQLDADVKICNGLPNHMEGLLLQCPFPEFPFSTCYGCPSDFPSPAQPVPPQVQVKNNALRFRLPANCSTAFWDPIAGSCLPNGQVNDVSRPIGPNGADLTGGGTGASPVGSSSVSAKPTSYTPFSHATQSRPFVAFAGAAAAGLLMGGGTLLL